MFGDTFEIAVDASGTIFVSDPEKHRIRLIREGQVSTLTGNGSEEFADRPTGIAVDGSKKIYIADSDTHLILLIQDGKLSTLAGNGSKGFADGPASSAMFAAPTGVAVDASGKIYIADTENHRIRMITP